MSSSHYAKKIQNQACWLCFFACLTIAFLLFRFAGIAAEPISDAQRRQKIEGMYTEYKKKFPAVEDIDPKEAMRLQKNKKIIFIDVREPEEQQISMLPDAITDRAYLENPQKYNDYLKIGYCTISYRSGKLAQKLEKKGITLLNLRGGLLAWVHDGGKVYHQAKETHRIHVYGPEWNLGPDNYEAIW
jgi:rhodanese-related sulfurtransferase